MNSNLTGKIAIIDDDDPLRGAIVNLLTSCGFDPLPFASAEAYLSRAREDQIQLIISDVHMPGMSGIELYNHCRASGDATPLILISGHPHSPAAVQRDAPGVLAFLLKPLEADILAALIGSVLNTAPRR